MEICQSGQSNLQKKIMIGWNRSKKWRHNSTVKLLGVQWPFQKNETFFYLGGNCPSKHEQIEPKAQFFELEMTKEQQKEKKS